MPILYQKFINREDVAMNTKATYVFGDNDVRQGFGGQAAAMRGFPNSIGVRTKKYPSIAWDSFYNDAEYDDNVAKMDEDLDQVRDILWQGRLVIMPMDGLGTGLSDLANYAPKTAKWLNEALEEMRNDYAYSG